MAKGMSQIISNCFICAIALFLVSSCNDGVAYNKSADVHQQGWTPADTLLFEFIVADSIQRGMFNTLEKGHRYDLSLSLRYSDEYQYVSVPLHIVVDSVSYAVSPKLNRPLSWGSLMFDDFIVKGIPVAFQDTGYHRIAIYPDTILIGIYSAGIDIR